MKKLLLLLCLLCVTFLVNAQSVLNVFTDWTGTNGSQNFFYKNIVKTDASANVFIAGATKNASNNYDILVAKYNSKGVLQWIQQYNGAGNGDDMALGLYIDASGYVYITGTVTTATNVDAITIKYNSSGVQQWLSTYNGTGSAFDTGTDLTTDASGNVYITGTSYNASGNSDVILIKYNSSGTQQWVSRYNYMAQLNDAGAKIVWNGSNLNVYVLLQVNSTTYKGGTLTYNTSGSLINWVLNSTNNSTGIDQVNDMVTDASGNIYIAGAIPVTGEGYNYDVMKLNSNLNPQWVRTFNGTNSLNDIATGLKVDASGNVYVTGYSNTTNQGKDIITLKYNSSGTLQWSRTYNDALNKDDEANAMVMDPSGNIYITGSSFKDTNNTDYFTIKYDASGTIKWTILTDGNAHLNDKATNIAIDNAGNIIVTGESETAPGVFEYLTVKYVEKQVITPTDFNSETPPNSFSYYINRGQLINTSGSPVPDIKYYTTNSSPVHYIKDNSSSFVFAHIDSNPSTLDTLQRIDLTYDKVNAAAKTYPMVEHSDFLNYFLAQCPSGITQVHGNQRLITTDLYPNIDLMYSSNQDGIKYYYIIKPGGTPTNIHLIFTGATSFNLNGSTNVLTINSSIGSISFERPTVYQLDASNNIIPITGWTADWQTNGASNLYKFNIGAYDNTKPLIIQVDRGHSTQQITQNGNLEWSTNYGVPNDLDNLALDVTTDPTNGGSYVVGKTNSSNFPVNVGLNQPYYGGNTDGFILSFNQNANINWATFYGGSGFDAVQSVAYNNQSIYITGVTMSQGTGINHFPYMPTTNPNNGTYYKNTNSGGKDAFIARITATTGNLTWSSFIGGEGDDDGKSIAIDNNGNIYIAGNTTSTNAQQNNCLATTGAQFPLCDQQGISYFQDHKEGGQDIFIMKFNSNNNLIWSTFYGSDVNDEVFEINCPGGGDESLILVGNTDKSSDPLANYDPTVYQNGPRTDHNFPLCDINGTNDFFQATGPIFSGSSVGFISRFSTSGNLLWATNMRAIKEFQTVTSTYQIIMKKDLLSNPSNGGFYVAGYTEYSTSYITGISSCNPVSTSHVPICNVNGGYTNDGTVDNAVLYIARFNLSNCGLSWSTLYPGRTNMKEEYPVAFDPQSGVINAEKKTIDITVDASQDLYLLGTGLKNIYTTPSIPTGAYYKDYVATGDGMSSDAYILSFKPSNDLVWATYFGTDAPTYIPPGLPWPHYADFGGAIATYKTDKLYIVGYSGCGAAVTDPIPDYKFPWADPHYGAYMFYAYAEPTNWSWNAFISRFGLSSIGVSINETQSNDLKLNVYPNPAAENINVTFPLIKNGKYEILNILGGKIICGDIKNTNSIVINLNQIKSGLYLIKVYTENHYYSNKFIKE